MNNLGTEYVYTLVKRLLDLNDSESQPIEVVLFSRNDPDTGLRVFNSIEHYGLNISRAVFVAGKNPYQYLQAFNASLFLSGNKADVREAMEHGFPAGYVSATEYADDVGDQELRMAFDLDAVIADDSSERVNREQGLTAFHQHESEHGDIPMREGPLLGFLKSISNIQKAEIKKESEHTAYQAKIRIAVCTARDAPAHKRVVTTLR